MSALTSHVLDTAVGAPARALALRLDVLLESESEGEGHDGGWQPVASSVTDHDGRVRDLLGGAQLEARTYRVTFETGAYFRAAGRPVFYPRVEVIFTITAPTEHHHIPLLLAPYGYSTYRGS
jgi:5-hydroxyisourate hydrolase